MRKEGRWSAEADNKVTKNQELGYALIGYQQTLDPHLSMVSSSLYGYPIGTTENLSQG